jgi:hypothetical protein
VLLTLNSYFSFLFCLHKPYTYFFRILPSVSEWREPDKVEGKTSSQKQTFSVFEAFSFLLERRMADGLTNILTPTLQNTNTLLTPNQNLFKGYQKRRCFICPTCRDRLNEQANQNKLRNQNKPFCTNLLVGDDYMCGDDYLSTKLRSINI